MNILPFFSLSHLPVRVLPSEHLKAVPDHKKELTSLGAFSRLSSVGRGLAPAENVPTKSVGTKAPPYEGCMLPKALCFYHFRCVQFRWLRGRVKFPCSAVAPWKPQRCASVCPDLLGKTIVAKTLKKISKAVFQKEKSNMASKLCILHQFRVEAWHKRVGWYDFLKNRT